MMYTHNIFGALIVQKHYFMLACIGRPIIYLHVYLAIHTYTKYPILPRTYHYKLLTVDVVVRTAK